MKDRREVLARTVMQLGESKGAERRQAVEEVLAAAGECLRRRGLGGADRPALDAALRALSPADVAGYVAGVDVAVVETRLRRAADEALEAALPEDDADAGTWSGWAAQGVEARDRLESQLEALRARETVVPVADAGGRQALEAAVAALDASLRPLARRLTALNPWRRAVAEDLLEGHAARAWWLTERAACDGFLGWLGGGAAPPEHLATCPGCRADLEETRGVDAPRTRHLSEEELWELDLDLASPAARAFARAHAGTCAGCARALAALEEAEDAIRAAEPPAPAPITRLPTRARTPEPGPDVLADHSDFRVLAFRRPGRLRLVLQPHGGARIAAVALHLSHDPGPPLVGRSTAEGFEFEVAPASGAARMRVQLAGGREVEQDLSF